MSNPLTLTPAVELWQQSEEEVAVALKKRNTAWIQWDRRPDPLFIDDVRNLPKKDLRSFAADMRIKSASYNDEVHLLLQAYDGLGPYQELARQDIRTKLKKAQHGRSKARRFLNEAEIEISERREANRQAEEQASKAKEERRIQRLALEADIGIRKEQSDHDKIAKYQSVARRAALYELVAAVIGQAQLDALQIDSYEASIAKTEEWASGAAVDQAVAAKYIVDCRAELERQRAQLAKRAAEPVEAA